MRGKLALSEHHGPPNTFWASLPLMLVVTIDISRTVFLSTELDREAVELKNELDWALHSGTEAQNYFCVSEKERKSLPPCEDFFAHFVAFLESLEAAWNDIERHPARLQLRGKSGPADHGEVIKTVISGTRLFTQVVSVVWQVTCAPSTPLVLPEFVANAL